MLSCRMHPHKWMLAPLCLLLAELGAGFPPTYQWKDAVTDAKVTCQQCPPGTFVAQHCSSARPTVCAPCPDLHYTQYWNYLERCRYCNVICEEKQVEVQQCNATHNRVCQCREGYFAENEFCIPHSECPPGSGVISADSPRRPGPGSRAAIQEKFRTYLMQRKEGHHEVTRELLGALRATKLHALEEQVRERFLAHGHTD
ncbi:PREDICTED: tumor necrosis factor receptor superfamily member 6B [Tinamus guttatus]|uniref:tumor necrosis factor receptor superfamily member 6B n=1 Tax=Tinamus guttatus TaxID=94827 RepID=UPI00052F03AA|nr:PREDICTED: tumor necrosis factor receptor superfamily member 6B [Tinamus guttatus]